MSGKKYKVKKKSSAAVSDGADKKPKSGFSARQKVLLLLMWGAVCAGLYAALAKISFFFSLYVFVFIFVVAFVMYFITGIKMAKLAKKGDGDSKEFIKLADRSKMLLIIMIPALFVVIFDFIYTTIKLFM